MRQDGNEKTVSSKTITHKDVKKRLTELGDAQDAAVLQRYFKTGPGEYGAGDRFRGIRVPVMRGVVKEFRGLPLEECTRLLQSPWHEDRLVALLLWVHKFEREAELREEIFNLYLANTARINNWDLVDCSAPHIVGAWLLDKDRSVLDRLADSSSLWERRIAIIATQHFIGQGQFDDTLRLSGRLLGDREDLMHKAAGWMLREVGKRDLARLTAFLCEHQRSMPRTMLRYAIEHFDKAQREHYLSMKKASDK